MRATIAALLKPLSEARRVVILSGAGLSADSGIPTFRDGATGLWANIDPDEVVSIRGFENNADKVWAWHEAMHALFAGMHPNAGHRGIASLEWQLPRARVTVITQNIDGLHQAAGSARVIELHDSGLRVRCHDHCGFVAEWPTAVAIHRHCPACGAPVRPDVVWFGEPLDTDQFALARKAALEADIFFAVGTSSSVHPASILPLAAKDNGALLVEINPHPTPISGQADSSIRAKASVFFPALSDALSRGVASFSWEKGICRKLLGQIEKRVLPSPLPGWHREKGVALRGLFTKSASD